ncbi:MAG: zf-HC2 domain-containing protein [Vicinamibacterales bacterium]
MSARTHAGGPRHCRQLLTDLLDYLDGELSAERCRALERHLDDCHCCGELADSTRRAMALCQESGRQPLPAGVRLRARRRAAALLAKLEADVPAAKRSPATHSLRRVPARQPKSRKVSNAKARPR